MHDVFSFIRIVYENTVTKATMELMLKLNILGLLRN